MPEHELWITALFNQYLAGVANSVLSLARVHIEDPAHPWANFVVMQIVVALILMITFAILRPRISPDKPGKLQHIFEAIYGFVHDQADEVVGHSAAQYVSFFGTIFLFILFSNLIGIIPAFESPTMSPAVPLGCAVAVFLYYNLMGIRSQGLFKYLAHFAGPLPILAPLMVPIELISHAARVLSLTIRLYANMFAGEQVTLVFVGMTYLVIPVVFMGLHVFVALLQAFIFMLLAMVYLQGAVAEEH
jgi:F-type H+-transporting ATPase subunit a